MKAQRRTWLILSPIVGDTTIGKPGGGTVRHRGRHLGHLECGQRRQLWVGAEEQLGPDEGWGGKV